MLNTQNTQVSEEAQQTYDSYYSGGETEWRRVGALCKTKNIVSLAGAVPHRTVLEIGSGDGAILKRLDELRFAEELFSLEISTSAIDTIRARNIPSLREVQRFDGYHIPYSDAQFDLAVLSHVVEHVEHPRTLLFEAARVARHLFIEVPTEDNAGYGSKYKDDGVGHINHYTPRSIQLLLETCGFEIIAKHVETPSVAVHQMVERNKGTPAVLGVLKYGLKEITKRILPPIASAFFTYHCAMLVRSKSGNAG